MSSGLASYSRKVVQSQSSFYKMGILISPMCFLPVAVAKQIWPKGSNSGFLGSENGPKALSMIGEPTLGHRRLFANVHDFTRKRQHHPCGPPPHVPLARGDVTEEPLEDIRDPNLKIFAWVLGPLSPSDSSPVKEIPNGWNSGKKDGA